MITDLTGCVNRGCPIQDKCKRREDGYRAWVYLPYYTTGCRYYLPKKESATMGIDMYLSWKGITQEQAKARYCGFDITKGNMGYLREAYHGGPYATQVLAPECWEGEQKYDSEDDYQQGVQIPAATLRARLPDVLAAALERAKSVYQETEEEAQVTLKSFTDFVELAERKEAETGEPCWVYSSY